MLQNIYEFWGTRDLNNFLKGNRKLENEKTFEQQNQKALEQQNESFFWVAKDLNLFLKGNRKLEPMLEQNDIQPPLDTNKNQNVPILGQQQIEPPKPRILGLRQNMSIFIYGLFPPLNILLSILRMLQQWLVGLPISVILPGFILWFIAWVTYIVGAFFISWDFKQSFFKPTIIILAISLLFDVTGLLVTTIQFGILVSSTEVVCETQTLDESEGYYYDIDYLSIDQRSLDVCVEYESSYRIGYNWLILFLVVSFIIYCSFFILIYKTIKVQPKQQTEQRYVIEAHPQNLVIQQ